MMVKVTIFLSSYHLAHKFNGRVVLTRIFRLFTRHLCCTQRLLHGINFKHEGVARHFDTYRLGFVTNHREAQTASFKGQLEVAV